MITFFEYIKLREAVKKPRDISEITPYHVRWMIRRDFPEVIKLAKTHPDFMGMEDKEIEEKFVKLLRLREAIGIVAEDSPESTTKGEPRIIGAAIYTLHDDHYQMPFIAAENPDVAYHLINRVKKKLPPEGVPKRSMMYVRTHLDPNVTPALRDHGMVTKPVDDEIHAKYPVTNMQHKNVYDPYHSVMQGEQPAEEKGEEPDDPYGLFKDKPWER